MAPILSSRSMQLPGMFASLAGGAGTAFITYDANTTYYRRYNALAADATNVYLGGVVGDYSGAWNGWTTSNKGIVTKINHVAKTVSFHNQYSGNPNSYTSGVFDLIMDSSSNWYFAVATEPSWSNTTQDSRPWLGKFNSSDVQQWGYEYRANSRGQSGLNSLFLSGSTIYAPGNSNAGARGVFHKINTSNGSSTLAAQLDQGAGTYSNGKSGRVYSDGRWLWQTWIDSGPPALNVFNSNNTINTSRSYGGTIYPGCMNLDSAENLILGGHNNAGAARIAKVNTSFSTSWARGFTATGTTNCEQVLIDTATNDIYAVIPEVYDSTNEYYYSYLVKYNSSGSIQWQRRFTSSFNGLKINDIKMVGDNFHICGHLGGKNNGSKAFYIKMPWATAPTAQTIEFTNGDTITIANGSGTDSSQTVTLSSTSFTWGSDSAGTTSYTPSTSSKSLTTVNKAVI